MLKIGGKSDDKVRVYAEIARKTGQFQQGAAGGYFRGLSPALCGG